MFYQLMSSDKSIVLSMKSKLLFDHLAFTDIRVEYGATGSQSRWNHDELKFGSESNVIWIPRSLCMSSNSINVSKLHGPFLRNNDVDPAQSQNINHTYFEHATINACIIKFCWALSHKDDFTSTLHYLEPLFSWSISIELGKVYKLTGRGMRTEAAAQVNKPLNTNYKKQKLYSASARRQLSLQVWNASVGGPLAEAADAVSFVYLCP